MKKLAALFALGLLVAAQGASAQTLKAVKDRGMLNCGSNGTLAGFGLPDAQGNWTGLDVEFCRAVAAAVLGDAKKVKFVPLTAKDRFTELQSGEVDVLARNTTWTSSRDTSLGLNFTGVNYYDGQGFMVRKALKVNSALELNGASMRSRVAADFCPCVARHSLVTSTSASGLLSDISAPPTLAPRTARPKPNSLRANFKVLCAAPLVSATRFLFLPP